MCASTHMPYRPINVAGWLAYERRATEFDQQHIHSAGRLLQRQLCYRSAADGASDFTPKGFSSCSFKNIGLSDDGLPRLCNRITFILSRCVVLIVGLRRAWEGQRCPSVIWIGLR
jgi:hypothetical protein